MKQSLIKLFMNYLTFVSSYLKFFSQNESSVSISTQLATSAMNQTTMSRHQSMTLFNLRKNMYHSNNNRGLQSTTSSKNQEYYYTTTELGIQNFTAALGNPMKGLARNPTIGANRKTGVAFSLEHYYYRFDSILRGPNDYNWTLFDLQLDDTVSRNAHSIPRFHIHYPGEVLALPPHLLDTIELRNIVAKGQPDISPYYGDPILRNAMKEFIYEFGKRYDGDKRIAFIQAGLLGYWGEWHTVGYGVELLPESVKDEMVQWYFDAFRITKIQIRNARPMSQLAKMGYHDDSFTYTTLDAASNGGVSKEWYFWNRILDANEQNFWKYAPMGGEIHPSNDQDVFEPTYPSGTLNHQDFSLCVNTTHATYMKNGYIFRDVNMSRIEIDKANQANIQMGYNYQITQVAVSPASTDTSQNSGVNVEVTIVNTGVAPFYYPLSLTLKCNSASNNEVTLYQQSKVGVEELLVEQNVPTILLFSNVPSTSDCLSKVSMTLTSTWLLPNQIINFAQGIEGTVSFSLPSPPIITNPPPPITVPTTDSPPFIEAPVSSPIITIPPPPITIPSPPSTITTIPTPPITVPSPPSPIITRPSISSPVITIPPPPNTVPTLPSPPIAEPPVSSPIITIPPPPITVPSTPSPTAIIIIPSQPTNIVPKPPVLSPPVATCFSSINTVKVKDIGDIPLSQLKIGDYVKTNHDDETYTQVYGFGHYDHDREELFLRMIFASNDDFVIDIHLSNSNKNHQHDLSIEKHQYTNNFETINPRYLEISPNHLIFVKLNNWQQQIPIRALDVVIGDQISHGQIITSIERIKRRGVYAPLTRSGELIVSGVHVSNYVNLFDIISYNNKNIINDNNIKMFIIFNQHTIGHILFTPQRLFCQYYVETCKKEYYIKGYGLLAYMIISSANIIKYIVELMANIINIKQVDYLFEMITLIPQFVWLLLSIPIICMITIDRTMKQSLIILLFMSYLTFVLSYSLIISQNESSVSISTQLATSAMNQTTTSRHQSSMTLLNLRKNMYHSTNNRGLQSTTSSKNKEYYYTTTELGIQNFTAALGNPMKGLARNPSIAANRKTGVVFSLEHYYYRFDSILRGPNDYNWTLFDLQLNDTASRNAHSVPRFHIHYPGEVLALPPHLLDTIKLRSITAMGQPDMSPYYGDPILRNAMKEFIYAFGKRYDGDKRIAFIQAGLLGYWGEWHTVGYGVELLPESVKDEMVQWYFDAFRTTKIQIRNARPTAQQARMGYHDDSFTYTTLDGSANGGVSKEWYFWNRILDANEQSFWKYAPMGGEIHPSNDQDVFEPTYPAGTVNHQDFSLCVNTTHATYMKNGLIFRDINMSAYEIDKANQANIQMGYNYQITQVAVSSLDTGDNSGIDVDVTIVNSGVAPFYYPLSLTLTCNSFLNNEVTLYQHSKGDVEALLVEQNVPLTLSFSNVPSTTDCLTKVSMTLTSSWLLPDQTIHFAQGSDGKVSFSIPSPPIVTGTPSQRKCRFRFIICWWWSRS